MRILTRLATIVVLLPGLAGCLTSESLIRLNADGSGTIENVLLVNDAVMADMAGMFGGEAKPGAKEGFDIPLDEASLRAEAEKFGRGVRYVSSEPMARGELKGARMVFAFDDVNALRVATDPLGGDAGGGDADASGDKGEEPVRMALTRLPGGNSLLTIRMDETERPKTATKNSDGPNPGKAEMPPEMMEMMTRMFEGFRVAVDVEVNGPVVRSSSPFTAGSRVTVLEMDLGLLLKDQTNMKRLMELDPGMKMADLIPALKDVKGIKVNQSPITIEFAGR